MPDSAREGPALFCFSGVSISDCPILARVVYVLELVALPNGVTSGRRRESRLFRSWVFRDLVRGRPGDPGGSDAVLVT